MGDEIWRVGYGYDFKDFNVIFRNFIVDNWELLKVFKLSSDVIRIVVR